MSKFLEVVVFQAFSMHFHCVSLPRLDSSLISGLLGEEALLGRRATAQGKVTEFALREADACGTVAVWLSEVWKWTKDMGTRGTE